MTGRALHADGLLLDMDGVLTVSTEPLPGAVDAVARLHRAGVPMRVLTNTTAYTQAAIGAGLRSIGFPIADDEVFTAPVAAVAYVRAQHPGARVFVLGDAQHDDMRDLHRVGVDERPDVVLVSGADESFTFDTLNRVYRVLLDGAALVSMHRNLSWMTSEGECLDAGAYVLGLERAVAPRGRDDGQAGGRLLPRRPAVARTALRACRDGRRRHRQRRTRRAGRGPHRRARPHRQVPAGAAGPTPSQPPQHVVDSIVDVPSLLGC